MRETGEPAQASPGSDARADVLGGAGWLALGLVVLVLSWRMDRLQSQDIDPYTAPGLVPGLLGLGMMGLAAIMLVRGLRRGGWCVATAAVPLDWRRLMLVLLLCVGFGAGLLGRLPFGLAAALFVALSIVVLRWHEQAGRRLRGVLQAAAIGLCAGFAVFFVFERLFLVRLP